MKIKTFWWFPTKNIFYLIPHLNPLRIKLLRRRRNIQLNDTRQNWVFIKVYSLICCPNLLNDILMDDFPLMSFCRMPFCWMTLCWMTFCWMTFWWMIFHLCHSAECHSDKCQSVKCHSGECHSAEYSTPECHSSQCNYNECHFILLILNTMLLNIPLLNAMLLNVILLNVISLNATAPDDIGKFYVWIEKLFNLQVFSLIFEQRKDSSLPLSVLIFKKKVFNKILEKNLK